MFDQNPEPDIEHIELAKWADVILIAPATANVIAKLAHGIADDLLATVCLATCAAICIAPAMNKEMWDKEVTKLNVDILKQRGVYFFGPGSGIQACGDIGDGRMLEPSEIVSALQGVFVKPLFSGKTVVITSGPTIEPIDPVRFISNHSSGKMGYAIAEAFTKAGANVILITGLTYIEAPQKAKVIAVTTAEEMLNVVMREVINCDIFVAVAAVSDYKAAKISPHKIKKEQDILELQLVKNEDILAKVAALPKPPFIVGFAAETENLLENARKKLEAKNIDLIAVNDVSCGKGMKSDINALTVISKKGNTFTLTEKSKVLLANELLEIIFQEL
jgi:phosphopantothenoylcysteine decarboxylase/phosphopantothenate--cysteine ligase